MASGRNGYRYRSPYEPLLRLLAFAALIFVSLAVFILAGGPINQWLTATAELQLANVELRQLELERQTMILQQEIAKQDIPPERVVITETIVKEIEPSWIKIVFLNWVFPILGVFLLLLFIFGGLLFLYDQYGSKLISRSRASLSIFSASMSVAGMVFAALKYQSQLLEHEVGAYLFLSCLYSLIFFSLLITTNLKSLAASFYAILLLITVLVGWFTAGSPLAILSEYQELLTDLTIPLQTLIVLGTLLPVLLVVASLFMKPDAVESADW